MLNVRNRRSRLRNFNGTVVSAETNRIAAIRALNPYSWYSAEYGQPKNVGYVQLNTASGDNIYTPDSIALDITGDIEVVMRLKVTDWTSGAVQTLVGKWGAAGQRSYMLQVTATGSIIWTGSADGTASSSSTVVPSVALVDNTWQWIRCRWGTGGSSVETAADQAEEPTVWTANGVQATVAPTFFNSTTQFEIGTQTTTTAPLGGQVSRSILRDGLAGEVRADFDARRCYGDGYTNEFDEYGTGTSRYVPLSGRTGDYITTPDNSVLRVTGDLEIVMRVAATDWTPSAFMMLLAKFGAAGNRAYQLGLNTNGTLLAGVSVDGTLQPTVNSTSAVAFADGVVGWIKFTWRASDGRLQFFTAVDQATEPTLFTQLGTDLSIVVPGIAGTSAPLVLGANSQFTQLFKGRIYRAIVRDAIDGPNVANFSAIASGPYGYVSTVNSLPWTITVPDHKGAWLLGNPKIYDRSVNARAPLTFGTGTNSPQWLPYLRPAVQLPGASTDYINMAGLPSHLGKRIRFEIECTLSGAISSSYGLGWISDAATSSDSVILEITSGNLLRARIYDSGATLRSYTATVALPFWATKLRTFLRFDCVPDIGGGISSVSFYVSLDGVYWAKLGATINVPSSGEWKASGITNTHRIGNAGGGNTGMPGSYHSARMLFNEISVWNWDAKQSGQAGYTDSISGFSWTNIRNTTGRKSSVQTPKSLTARAGILHGTDDFIDVPVAAMSALDVNAAASSVALSARRWHNPGTLGHPFFTTKANSTDITLGYALRMSTVAASTNVSGVAGDAVATDSATVAAPLGERSVLYAAAATATPFIDVQDNKGTAVTDVAKTTTVSTSTGLAGRIGAYTTPAGYIDMEFEEIIFFSSALSSGQRSTLTDLLAGG